MSGYAMRVWVVWLVCAMASAAVCAQTRVEVVETWPPGEEATLARKENFYVRLAYETDVPVRIWVRPYFRGEQVRAGSHPSERHSGSGEALGWFFLSDPSDRVDELRIEAGDGSPQGTSQVATHRVRVAFDGGASRNGTPPAWVETLRARQRAAQQQEDETYSAASSGIGGTLLAMGMMLALVALGGFGIVVQVQALRHWRGVWRIGAMVPAVLVGLAVLNILLGVLIDPTSHNLWPLEILMAGLIGGGVLLALFVVRKLGGKGLRD